ncbi:uncharacterized protein PITG_02816 [Phytophthora infestans T30-4]|uniref:Uncharacterized protein n=1 Tax=Phytophthora infestans (strain T30-4) TaxID=403677 RepID=D0MXA9_PHYIT|nr:uncharacterized protein PITG_02816 [Phytophthora infestans T30-4]EEY64272.1 hypothetical protein PITG_02816 [Phytophthora infestans T30-4]|eukprot:XP_002907708.1 hypothetical protein PITG_02816 [Phytophthora infestans T30-4]
MEVTALKLHGRHSAVRPNVFIGSIGASPQTYSSIGNAKRLTRPGSVALALRRDELNTKFSSSQRGLPVVGAFTLDCVMFDAAKDICFSKCHSPTTILADSKRTIAYHIRIDLEHTAQTRPSLVVVDAQIIEILLHLPKHKPPSPPNLLRGAAPVRQSRFTVPPLTTSPAALHCPSPTAALCFAAPGLTALRSPALWSRCAPLLQSAGSLRRVSFVRRPVPAP